MADSVIDLRSDTVTKPSLAMRRAMSEAEVGDDVFGEDPTVNRLQQRLAELFGKEDALFTPSGVMANQLAIKVLTQPGDEVIVERDAHVFQYETSAPSLISGVQLLTVQGTQGVLTAEQVLAVLRPRIYFMPRSALVCLENTHNRAGGALYPLEEIKRIREVCRQHSLALHLDGARIWNAWVATGIHPKEYASCCDTVSVCFSKGLGAPVGSALVGSRELIERARKVRKILGGGMRQAGILAAAALYALENNVGRLKEDHEKAKKLAEGVSSIRGVKIENIVETNIVMVDVSGTGRSAAEVLSALRSRGVLLTDAGSSTVRAVTHMDVSMEEVSRAISIFKSVIST